MNTSVRTVRTHQQIDQRSLAMASAIVAKIDRDPAKIGLAKARATCQRWWGQRPLPAFREWLELLGGRGRKSARCFSTNRNWGNGCGRATLSAASSRRKNAGKSIEPAVRRADLEHLLRAAGSIADARKLVIINPRLAFGERTDQNGGDEAHRVAHSNPRRPGRELPGPFVPPRRRLDRSRCAGRSGRRDSAAVHRVCRHQRQRPLVRPVAHRECDAHRRTVGHLGRRPGCDSAPAHRGGKREGAGPNS